MSNLHACLVCFVPLQNLQCPRALRKQMLYEHRRCVRQTWHLIILWKGWRSVKPTLLARLGMWTLSVFGRSVSSLWILMNETVLTYCIHVDFLQLWASGRQETNQVTILPSPLLPNWLPGDPRTELLMIPACQLECLPKAGQIFPCALREQPNFQKHGNHPVIGNAELWTSGA